MVTLMVVGEHYSEISFFAESFLPIVLVQTQMSNWPTLFFGSMVNLIVIDENKCDVSFFAESYLLIVLAQT